MMEGKQQHCISCRGWDVMMKMVGKVKTFDTGFGERRDTEVESKWQNVIFFVFEIRFSENGLCLCIYRL